MPKQEPATRDAQNLIWIDLEMTGLDPDRDVILEVATLVTDKDLNILAEGPVFAIHQPDSILNGMDEWNTKQHGASGLTKRVRESRIDTATAEAKTLEFLLQYVPPGVSPICGNSVCQDRRFLWRHMPSLEEYFFYRHIDVSTIKELVRRWKTPEELAPFEKKASHLALDDIYESIAELRYYREQVFV